MADNAVVRAEDLVPVRSRVSWGPIFAGAALALALYFLLTLLGGAIGFSVSGNVRADNLLTGAAIWALITTGLCLFVGGFVTSQFTVGENKVEAVAYGLIMWAVVFASLMWLMASGARSGFHAMVGLAQVGVVSAKDTTQQDWEAAARQAGISQEQIDDARRKAKDAPNTVRDTVGDPQSQQAAAEATTRVTWWAFGITLVSILAAAFGALVGSGPSFRLLALGTRLPPTVYEGRQAAGRT